MKEIVYIQAGNISNYIGTHFWNTQETYFTYDGASEPLIDHDISFREGLSDQNEPTFCPRVLIFDHKSNFGPLSKYNELYPEVRDPEQPFLKGLWNGPISEHRQEGISRSEYQRRLDEGEVEEDYGESSESSRVRFWSDVNCVYYIPRSIQQVPDLPDWQANSGDWNHGRGVYERYNLDNSLVEESLRQFIEECNHFQGFQISFDNSSFGGFTISLLENIRDDFPKVPILTFPVLSGIDPSRLDVGHILARKLALQDAACLFSLHELETQSIPLRNPDSWRLGRWSELLALDKSSLYRTSALLSAHMENATCPLRTKGRNEELSDFCAQLNWSQNTPISQLAGILPFRDDDDLDTIKFNFSTTFEQASRKRGHYLAQRIVSRGLDIGNAHKVDAYFTSRTGLEDPYLRSYHAPLYPLPTSFPNIIRPGGIHHSITMTQPPKSSGNLYGATRRSTTLLSTIFTTTTTGDTLGSYARLLQTCVTRRYGGADVAGLVSDELRDMVEKFTLMAEAYDVENEKEAEESLDDDQISDTVD